MKQDVQHVQRNHLALAFTACVHVMAVVIWMRQPHSRPLPQPQIVSILLQPALSAGPTRAAPSAPASMPPHDRVDKRPPRFLPPIVIPAEPRTPDAPAAPPVAALSVPAASVAAPADNGSASAAAPGTPPASGFDMALARRQARRLADDTAPREPKMQAEGDTRWARLSNALEAAHVAPTTGVQQDAYTAADGTIIYRKRIGNRTVCRMSGDTGSGGVVSTGGNGTAGWVSCPNDVQWKPLQ